MNRGFERPSCDRHGCKPRNRARYRASPRSPRRRCSTSRAFRSDPPGGVRDDSEDGRAGDPLRANVTDQQAVDSLVEETIRRLGPIDLLVNNAGVGTAVGPIWEVSPENWWQDVAQIFWARFSAVELFCRE
jgi:NAD(P)-dependent dehydrogenase (short-subunit alcohol dehydrogenase family)